MRDYPFGWVVPPFRRDDINTLPPARRRHRQGGVADHEDGCTAARSSMG